MTDAPFQLFPTLDPATESALRASIERFGVLVPVVVDQAGQVLDGHHRRRIADELGVAYRTDMVEVLDEDEAREVARTLNSDRRHLTAGQRREVVAALREEGHSLRAIAAATGVGKDTVAKDLSEVSTGRHLDTPAEVRGQDGKRYPASCRRPEEIAPELTDSDDPVAEAQAILDTLEEPTDDAVAEAVEEANESRRTPAIPTKPDLGGGVSHPARYSRELLPVLAAAVPPEQYRRVLDPFAGTGRIHELPNETVGIEIEPEWAHLHPDTIVGSALGLPFPDDSFDAIVTSPTYGNRLADSHNASDPERRRSYTHDLGRALTAGNSGAMQWGPEYREFHLSAWACATRVLRRHGRFVLNIKDHVRAGEVQHVSAWHLNVLIVEFDLELVEIHPIAVRSLRAGANGEARTTEEFVFVLEAS